jgi:hypothetical protein
MSDGRWLAAAALLALAGASRVRSGSLGVVRQGRGVSPRLVVRFSHKIAPRSDDVGETMLLPGKGEGWYPEGLFLDSAHRTVDMAYVRAVWKKLYPNDPLGRVNEARVAREAGKPVSIYLFNPSLWSTQHAIVLEIHDWEEGSRSVVRQGRRSAAQVPERGPGWVKPVIVKDRYGIGEWTLPENPVWNVPAEDVYFDMKKSRFPFASVIGVRGLAVDRDNRIYGIRSMTDVHEEGHDLEGRVSIGGKKYSAFTGKTTFLRPDGKYVDVATLHVRYPSTGGSKAEVRQGRTAPPPKYTYTVTYGERDPEGDEVESGFIVGGRDVPLPDGLHGQAAAQWHLENEVDEDLEPADEDDLAREAAHVDVEDVDMSSLSEGFLKAVAFGRLVRDAGATDDSGWDWWSTGHHQNSRTGVERVESYHPSKDLFVDYGQLIRYVVKKDRASVREMLEAAGAIR